MKIYIDQLPDGYYLEVEFKGESYNNYEIDLVLCSFTDICYEEIAKHFGGFVQDSSGSGDYDIFYNHMSQAERARSYILNLL